MSMFKIYKLAVVWRDMWTGAWGLEISWGDDKVLFCRGFREDKKLPKNGCHDHLTFQKGCKRCQFRANKDNKGAKDE